MHREVEGFGADLRDQLPRTVTSSRVFYSYNNLPLCTQGALRPRNWKCQCFPLVFLRPSGEELEIEVKGAAGENDNWELLNRRGWASCEHASKTHCLIEIQSWKGSCIKPSDIIPSFPRCRIQSQESGMVCSKLKLIRSNSNNKCRAHLWRSNVSTLYRPVPQYCLTDSMTLRYILDMRYY